MSESAQLTDAVAGFVVEALLNSIWQGMLLAFGVWVLLRLWSKIGSSNRYLICFLTLVVIGFLPFQHRPDEQKALSTPVAALSERDDSPMPPDQLSFGTADNQHEAAEETGGSDLLGGKPASPPLFRINLRKGSWIQSVFYGWLAVVVFLLGRLGVSCRHLRRLKRESTALPSEFSRLNAQATRGSIRICVSRDVNAPIAVGLFKPAVIIPEGLLQQLSPEESDQVIAHETAHLERWDDWTNLVQKIVEAVLFFHPAVWWISRRLCFEREVACDDRVVAAGGAKPYAACLARLAELVAASPRPITSAPLVTKAHLSRRIEMILDKSRRSSRHASKAWVTLSFLLLTIASVQLFNMGPLLAFTDANAEIAAENGPDTEPALTPDFETDNPAALPQNRQEEERRKREIEKRTREIEKSAAELEEQVRKRIEPQSRKLEEQIRKTIEPLERDLERQIREVVEPKERELEKRIREMSAGRKGEIERLMKEMIEPKQREIEKLIREVIEPKQRELERQIRETIEPQRRELEKQIRQITEVKRVEIEKQVQKLREHELKEREKESSESQKKLRQELERKQKELEREEKKKQ